MSDLELQSAAADRLPPADAPAAPLRTLLFGLVALLAGIGATRWLESRGTRPIPAFLQVRTTFVTAERNCRVVRATVAPGDRVTIGTPLVLLSDTALEENLQANAAQIEVLTTELRQAEARAKLEVACQQRDVDHRICQLQLQAAGYRQHKCESEFQRHLLADRLASHQSALWDNGEALVKSLLLDQRWPSSDRLHTAQQLESCLQLADLLDENVEICETRIAHLQQHREQLPEQVRESCGVAVIAARLKQAQAEADRLASLQTQLALSSPAVGQVGEFRSRPGDHLAPGDPIVELLDDSARYLVAEVPSTAIHEFRLGRTVALVFPGAQRRQGRVVRIAPQARPRDPSRPDADPIVNVEIEQAGRLWPSVPIGTRIDVHVDQPR